MLRMFCCVSVLGKRPAAPEGVSPVQWWILTDYIWGTKKYKLEVGDMRATELLKTTDPQTSSNTPGNTRDNIDEGQGKFSLWLVLEYSLHEIFLKLKLIALNTVLAIIYTKTYSDSVVSSNRESIKFTSYFSSQAHSSAVVIPFVFHLKKQQKEASTCFRHRTLYL